ncbi:MAG: Tm-1-like ATP-binding domain-containing protein [Deltaproteobacteria bacterium]|nr:Tm-1-like ATP-binding domain-containing protein [Deltaproteobacteria bacterium]
MTPTVVIVATLDTKGQEVGFLKELIEQKGCSAIVIDVGTLDPPAAIPDVTREAVAEKAGSSLDSLAAQRDRRVAVETMIRGASLVVMELHRHGKLSGVISIGGGTGTHIGMGIMRTLPLGVPKLMVSTVASRDMRELIGTKDIIVMHSVTDILGLNAVTKRILANAAAAIAGMAHDAAEVVRDKPVVGLTSFGFITHGAMLVKGFLEDLGYDVAPFHANGTGGMAMEDLIDQGLISGVLDLALHEFSDAMYGGYCGSIGPGRLESAGAQGIPQVLVPGGLDCIVLEFNSEETKPADMKGRKVFWYDFRSGVRTNRDDVLALAKTISEKLNRAKGPTKVVIPMRGWSEADIAGGPLDDPEVNAAFIDELKSRLRKDIPVVEVDAHICDAEFARAVVSEFHELMQASGSSPDISRAPR